MSNPFPYPVFALPERTLAVTVAETPGAAGAVGHAVFAGEGAEAAGLTSERLAELGFSGAAGQTLLVVGVDGPRVVLVGAGARDDADAHAVRDAAAVFTRAVQDVDAVAFTLPDTVVPTADVAAAAVEGAVLARYVHRIGVDVGTSLSSLTLVASPSDTADAEFGAERGRHQSLAAELARDLAGTPGGILTATRLGQVAIELGQSAGLEVTVVERDELVELRCGGLLGVNLGSDEPPVMIKLVYRPEGEPTGKLALVGKGIMYDAGGLALKPGDAMHATMKNDMTGASNILAAMSVLRALGCTTQVTGFLMCTDNMPSGSALRMGDIIVHRNGMTDEIMNTDAEGRLVMADALVLATEEPVDAIVDIATLTGACMRALGTEIAGLIGNHQGVIAQVKAAAERVDEPVWELPLARRYRKELDSPIADIRNLGGPNAGAIHAALFLEEFVGDTPWGHIDIAGTGESAVADKWRNKGTTGFGTRLLIDLALNFTRP
ncbi:MAG: leucyl aminopeptidase [Propionibacteriaceae bacterium]|nr:leucyl aminopeptidase [Propionibacteriaceae bacterium]